MEDYIPINRVERPVCRQAGNPYSRTKKMGDGDGDLHLREYMDYQSIARACLFIKLSE